MSIVSFLAVPIIIIAAAVIVVSLFLHFVPIGLWISAMAAGVSVGIVNLIGMRLRRVIPSTASSTPSSRPIGRRCP